MAKEALLAYPDFNKPFVIHTDASHFQLGRVISQDGKPIAFYSRTLNDAQTRYTTTERELLSIVETLKEYRNILLGQQIVVHTDHKNLVYKHFNTERVMRWRLVIEEFGPELRYIKGEQNVVADTLSRLGLTNEEFSPECFAAEGEPPYPLRYKEIRDAQQQYAELQPLFRNGTYKKVTYKTSHYLYELICNKDNKIVLPPSKQVPAVRWYHVYLLHPGEIRMELIIGQQYYWPQMRQTIKTFSRKCGICQLTKQKQLKRGLVPVKENVEHIPWHTLCIDLIGPYNYGKKHKDPAKDTFVELQCLTMIDPATGWFEIVDIPNKRADYIANFIDNEWLTRYPVPTEIIMDRGQEFLAEVQELLQKDYGINKKLISTRNPQANSIVERIHKVAGQMIDSCQFIDKNDLDYFGWKGMLAAIRGAVRATVHTTTRATPSQLIFGRDAFLNVSFEADWQYIKQRKQRLIVQNNRQENAKCVPHTYRVNNKVMIRLEPSRKHGSDKYDGPHTLTAIKNNGTVTLRRDANGGAVYETWNICNLEPCAA